MNNKGTIVKGCKFEQDIKDILIETKITWKKILNMDKKIQQELYSDEMYKPTVATINEDSDTFLIEIWYSNSMTMPIDVVQKVLNSINKLRLDYVTMDDWHPSYNKNSCDLYIYMTHDPEDDVLRWGKT